MEHMMNEHKEGMSQEMTMKGRCWHWGCCILPLLSLLMWIAGAVFLVLSWVSVFNKTGEIWGLGPQWYIWNAVMFGILAIYGSGRKMGRCRMGMCGCKAGCDCKSGACVCK